MHSTRDEPGVVALAGGGKILVAGGSSETGDDPTRVDLAAVRLNADGAFDTAFASAGKFQTSFGVGRQRAFYVAHAGGGAVFLAGEHRSDFGVMRLTSAGTLDPMFGDGGLITSDFEGRTDVATSVLPQADGRLLVAGFSSLGSSTRSIALTRLLSNGALDPSFGTGGRATTTPPPNSDLDSLAAAIEGCAVITTGVWKYDNNTASKTAMGVARYRR